ncbi:MAG: chorismate synthase [Clostridia bacterium]|nr:chorismate synthase [Clostridia bacterium]
MSSTLGKNLEISIFGESHGNAIGVVINGLPSGEFVDKNLINQYLKKRATGKDKTMTARVEADEVQFLSGIYNDYTTGTPLTMVIYNTGQHSKDYSNIATIARPSHADYSGFVRYKGFNDIRGGGHFSGRLTTPMVMAGALCLAILKNKGIDICANIFEIGRVKGERLGYRLDKNTFEELRAKQIQAIANEEKMREEILLARGNLDSVGGRIECAVTGIKAGVGSPLFDGVENNIAKAIFGIPAIKGIEFGEDCELRGSIYNDKLRMNGNIPVTITNHDGGINGGITNGMPILFAVKVKPTPSIARVQDTIDFNKMDNTQIEIVGRHDPCVVARAVPCVECMTAIAVLDMIMESKIYD